MYLHNDKINAIQIIDVLNKLNIPIIRGNQVLCFMHDDHKPSMRIYKDTNSWFCFTCNKGGGVIELIKEYLHCDKEYACKWLEAEFNIASSTMPWRLNKKKRQLVPNERDCGKIDVDSEILEWIIANTTLTTQAISFLENERKIKKSVYESLNIRSIDNAFDLIKRLMSRFETKRLVDNHIISKGKYGYYLTWDAPCLLFPFYDYSGRLVNIQSRYLNPIMGDYPKRFRFIKDSNTSLYNAYLLSTLSNDDKVLVTEGVTDALAALSCGINAVAVAGASAFKEEYVELLCGFYVFICPDNDAPGRALLKDLKKKMSKRLAVVRELKLIDGSKDIGAYYAKNEELRFG